MDELRPGLRSPSYPSISLREAVAAVRKIDAVYRKSPADREHAVKLIGYSSLSGPAAKALAALASFGLVERAGKGELRVTGRASRILHTDDQSERANELASAAIEPPIFQEMQDRWPGIVPPEDAVATYLRRQEFNETAIKPIVKAYLDTVAYLAENRTSDARLVSSHNDEGSVQAGVADQSDVFGVAAREVSKPVERPEFGREWIRNDLGPETRVSIYVVGEMGPREIGKLIRILEAQKAVLED